MHIREPRTCGAPAPHLRRSCVTVGCARGERVEGRPERVEGRPERVEGRPERVDRIRKRTTHLVQLTHLRARVLSTGAADAAKATR